MAKKKTNPEEHHEIVKMLEPFSKALGKAAGQVWKVFVMRYIARGVSELFLAGAVVYIGHDFIPVSHRPLLIIPYLIASVFIYDAIQLMINPYYFAMDDVAVRLKQENIFKR